MAHSGLDLRQTGLGVLVGRQLDVSVFLRKSLDNDVFELPLGDGFFHSGQSAAQAFCLHDVVFRVFVRPHGSGRQCHLQCADSFVGDPDVLLLQFLDRFLPVATVPRSSYACIATRRAAALSVAKYIIAYRSWLVRSNAVCRC